MKILKFFIIIFASLSLQQAFSQSNLPDAPKFLSASVIPESSPMIIQLKWEPSVSLDVIGYMIFKVVDVTETIAIVSDRLSISYTYGLPIVPPYEGYHPLTFRISSFDNNLQYSLITEPHTTMKLTYKYKKCNSEVTLNWTEYSGWTVAKYKIYRRTMNTAYEVVGEVSGNEQTFNDNNVDVNKQYHYYIEAVSQDNITATSNSVDIFTSSFIQPAYLRAERATVQLNKNLIDVEFSVDASSEMATYQIQRADKIDGEYKTITTIIKTDQEIIKYTDNDVAVNENIYFYRIFAVDSCGNQSEYSDVASNILLTVSDINNYNQKLNWTPYRNWDTGVKEYCIFNFFNEMPTLEPEEILEPTKLEAVHSIEQYILDCHRRKENISNKVCYYVEAYKNTSGTGTSENKSTSNIACVVKIPIIWVPNAFNPVSVSVENRTFKPLVTFIEKKSYEFVIYDRWGLEIWRTNNPYEGWDGKLSGEDYAPSQSYTYTISFKNQEGNKETKTGKFNMFFR